MYLVDTSVWINFLRGTKNKAVTRLHQIMNDQIPFGITGIIYQELLQGVSSELEFQKLKNYFSTQRFFHPKSPTDSYAHAAAIYFACRQTGVTVRSTLDCLITQICLEHQLMLLHSDKDFERIQKIKPDLRLSSTED